MITGDNQLTAAFIGKELSFGPTGNSLFAIADNNKEIKWNDIDDKFVAKTSSHSDVEKLSK
jgi:magnesium-transporting ATPase (P-type)